MQRKKIALTHLDIESMRRARSKWDNCSSSWQQIIQRPAAQIISLSQDFRVPARLVWRFLSKLNERGEVAFDSHF